MRAAARCGPVETVGGLRPAGVSSGAKRRAPRHQPRRRRQDTLSTADRSPSRGGESCSGRALTRLSQAGAARSASAALPVIGRPAHERAETCGRAFVSERARSAWLAAAREALSRVGSPRRPMRWRAVTPSSCAHGARARDPCGPGSACRRAARRARLAGDHGCLHPGALRRRTHHRLIGTR